ncbi:MAG: replicative DNA helicase [Acidimicrobiia bacterium]
MVQPLDDARRRRLPSGGSGGSRVPPHNLEAEESLLGAMLLSRDAIVSAVEVQLSPGDFYKPAHGHIFDAISSIYAQGEPADPVTVAEELRRAGLLDNVGGTGALVALQANTPAIGNAARYARIVEEHALLRKLIGVAGDIAEMGYSVPDDVTAAIDDAEALIFDVAQRRVTDTLAPLRDLLERHLDHIEALYERGDDITGVPTGYLDLDQQLAGLQPSNLVIVGGRPGTGKALALDTPVPTPSGWTTMGQLHPGHRVLDAQGQPCTVTFATPVQRGRRCFEVSFDDGSALVADADHQWVAADGAGPAQIVTTARMLAGGRWHVPLTQPLDLPDADLPVDPYVLGCWLGDGRSSAGEMRVGEADWRHFHGEFTTAGYAFQWRARREAAAPTSPLGFAWAGRPGAPLRVLSSELRAAGLGPGDGPKHVPAAYLRASAKQRLALLQGLCDRAGHVADSGAVELRSGSGPLLRQARELACSLGHVVGPLRLRRVRRARGGVATSWSLRWFPLDPVFRLPRKAARLDPGRVPARATRRAVVAIRPVASVPVRCITVDSPSAVYLAGESMVPTHNTSFALGIVAHAALESRTPVLMFSLEMSHLELTQRLLCAEARVDATRMRNGRLLESDWPKISHAVGRLAESPVFIDDNPRLTVMEIRAKARRLKSRAGLGLIVIDYLQLMTGRTNAENRQVEVSEISRGLKILARELQVPVIALSQLSRNLETRADKRPVLADLRESGSLEQDADVVIFLYRDEVYNRDSPDRGTAEVIVAKHRNGPTGMTQLAFLDHYTRFANMAKGV